MSQKNQPFAPSLPNADRRQTCCGGRRFWFLVLFFALWGVSVGAIAASSSQAVVHFASGSTFTVENNGQYIATNTADIASVTGMQLLAGITLPVGATTQVKDSGGTVKDSADALAPGDTLTVIAEDGITTRRYRLLGQSLVLAAGINHSVAGLNGVIYTTGGGDQGQLGYSGVDFQNPPASIADFDNIVVIDAGYFHNLALDAAGQVYSFGSGGDGRLGHGADTATQFTPKAIAGFNDIVAVSAGSSHSLILDGAGQVYSFGSGASGRLGQGNTDTLTTPTAITGFDNIVAVAAGSFHSLILDATGQVYSFGSGASGRLGHGNSDPQTTPTAIAGFDNIVAIVAAAGHSLILDADGKVHTFGSGQFGRLGHGDEDNQFTPRMVATVDNVVAIAAREAHSIILAADGQVYTFGAGSNGELGHGNNTFQFSPVAIADLDIIVAVAAGGAHSIIQDAEGKVYTFGAAAWGQLGHCDYEDRFVPAAIGSVAGCEVGNVDLSSLSLSAGTLSPAFNAGTTAYTVSVANATTSSTITPITDDAATTVTVNGTAVVSGEASGAIALDVGDNVITVVVQERNWLSTKISTVTVNRAATIGGTLSGLPDGTQVVLQNNVGDDLSLSADGSFTFAAEQADLSAYEVTVLTQPTAQDVSCSVSNGSGNVAGADVTDVTVKCGKSAQTVVHFASGSSFTVENNGQYIATNTADIASVTVEQLLAGIILKAGASAQVKDADGALKVSTDALAPGDTLTITADDGTTIRVYRLLGRPIGMAGGGQHTVVSNQGVVFTFGVGRNGQLGHGDIEDQFSPKAIANVGNIAATSGGNNHSLILDTNGQVYAFGWGGRGQLGQGDSLDQLTAKPIAGFDNIVAIAAGGMHSIILDADGQVYTFGGGFLGPLGHGDEEDQLAPKPIAGFDNIVAIAGGFRHSIILDADGQVHTFGLGNFGQLGHGDELNQLTPKPIAGFNNVVAIAGGNSHSIILDADGQVHTFGSGNAGKLGHNNTNDLNIPAAIAGFNNIVAIAAGGSHSLILDADGQVHTFGNGGFGRLGHGAGTSNQLTPKAITGFGNIVAIATVNNHSLILDADEQVYTFGSGSNGELGHCDTENRLVPTAIGTVDGCNANLTPPGFNINAGNAQTAVAGTAVGVAPSVIVLDANNNPVSGVEVTFTVASGGGAVDPAMAVTSNASGIAAVSSWTLGATAGENALAATSTGLTGSPVTFTATGTAGAASQMSIHVGNDQSTMAGDAVATPPSVLVRDANNNPASGVEVAFAVASGGGTVNPTTAVTTNADGIAAVSSWTLGTTAGENTLTATSADLTGSFTATGKEVLGLVLLDENGDPLGEGPLRTAEEIRMLVGDTALPLSISGTVNRAGDTSALLSGTGTGSVLVDPADDGTVLRLQDGEYFFTAVRGGVYILRFEDDSGALFIIEFDVRPQVAFSSTRQLGTSGEELIVRAVLEGIPGQFPVRVPYQVAGHSLLGASDFAGEGAFYFTAEGILSLTLTPDTNVGEVAITIGQGTDPEDALLGNPAVHRVVLREPQEVPLFAGIGASQNGLSVGALTQQSDGTVTLTARNSAGAVFDDTSHSFDWSDSALALGIHNETGATVTFEPALLSAGKVYPARAIVRENANLGRRASTEMRLRAIVDEDAKTLAAFDAFLQPDLDDPEGTRVHRVAICPQGEGDFREDSQRACSEVDRSGQGIFLEVPQGYRLNLGGMSERASWATRDFGLEVATDEILDAAGETAVNARDTLFSHLGYSVDFEISALDFPGQSVPVVMPLPAGESIPADAVWRKYLNDGWRTFVEDEANGLFSAQAPINSGACPWPGSDQWTPGLTEGDHCVRLIIQDGGPNDFDGEADGVIRDPGTLAVSSSTSGDSSTVIDSRKMKGGGGLGSMGGFVLVLAALVLLRQRHLGVAMVAFLLAGSAQADMGAPWYAGGQLGWAMTDISSAEVTGRMEQRDIDGSARVSDSDRLGLRAFVGYQWHLHLSLEAGYTDLGEITTRFLNTDSDLRAEDLRGVSPGSGRGGEAALVGRYPLVPDWQVLGRVGLLYWRASHELDGGGSDTNTGADAFFGLGVEYRFHEDWSARVSLDRYRVEKDNTDFVGVGVSYHFGRQVR